MAERQGTNKKSGQRGGPGDQKGAPGQRGQPERENTKKPGTGTKSPGGTPRVPNLDPEPSTRLPQYEDTPPPEMHDEVE
jgi:hypothetical protein